VPVVLLHGFPDDVRAWDETIEPLVAAGFRTLVPYLRGYGPTRFLDAAAPRMAQQAAIGQDLIDFLDALALPPAAPRRLRLGRPRRLHHGHPAPRARARARDHRRLQRAEHGGPAPPRLGASGARELVSVVLQYRTRGGGAPPQPPRDPPGS